MNDEVTEYPSAGVRTIAAASLWAAEQYGGRPALVCGGRRLSFSDYLGYARRAARGLIAAGVRPGDRVAIWAPNSIEFAVLALAIQLSGAALVPVNTRYTPREAADILARSGALLVFTVEQFLGRSYAEELRALCGEASGLLPQLPRIVDIDAPDSPGLHAFLAGGGAVLEGELDERIRRITPDDIATVLFTSGTTGQPKGAMLRHGALVRAYWNWGSLLGVRPGDRVLLSNPFFHAFGLKVGLLLSLLHGAAAYPMPVFDAEAALDIIERERISFYPAPPTVFQSLLAHPSLPGRDLASLRIAVTGATSVPPQLIYDMYDVFGFGQVFSPYGFTEGTGVATLTRQGDDRDTVASTAGKAVPGVEVVVLTEDGSKAAPGETGEIALRGYNLMAGYLGRDEAFLDAQGYLRSGDLGVLDERGYLKVTGRIKDMYIVGGFNVYPAEVEAVLQAHPGVLAAAVTGVPDERLGEVGLACVVRRDAGVSEAELAEWCRDRMANFKRPSSIRFVDALPLNASGKVIKDELVALAGES
ncbi:AMP-binding protein [Arthrobacter mobilis]|uniref:AMP-binding protein n=1 Tax=Arthrobacter mobilis TaxID=2724944 RepID=A0A7X6HGD5_9MICC|nr:AMP-binding protein [Arthrobacter mobilis]NKX55890.1 AMP-binding protein [Arthrobacter mobilis]